NPKHYALNSIEDTRFTVDVAVDERSLREVFLPHFRRAVQEGHAGAVMAAYNQVNGANCSENTHLLREVLDDDWGFQGFVESDWILGTRSTVPAVETGLDVEMPAPSYFGKPLADAVAAGQVRRKTIDAAVRRTLRAQLCFRLDADPPKVDPTQVETPAHVALALQAARESIVLLRNEARALPRGQDGLVAAVAAANPRTIVVLEGSGALLMPWLGQVSAVLMAWYPGEAGGTAIAEVLFGEVNPSGKLPVTFPRAESDLPPF